MVAEDEFNSDGSRLFSQGNYEEALAQYTATLLELQDTQQEEADYSKLYVIRIAPSAALSSESTNEQLKNVSNAWIHSKIQWLIKTCPN